MKFTTIAVVAVAVVAAAAIYYIDARNDVDPGMSAEEIHSNIGDLAGEDVISTVAFEREEQGLLVVSEADGDDAIMLVAPMASVPSEPIIGLEEGDELIVSGRLGRYSVSHVEDVLGSDLSGEIEIEVETTPVILAHSITQGFD